MIQIVVCFTLFFQYCFSEPPVNTYLPSSKLAPFSKTYSPPAANVSFNFGFSPRASKSHMFRDSLPMHDSANVPTAKTHEPFYRNKEFLEKIGNNDSNDLNALGKISVDGQHDARLHTSAKVTPHSSYESHSNHHDSHSTRAPYVEYGTPAENSLPVIEENLVQRNAHDFQRKPHQQSAIHSDNVSGRSTSYPGYESSGLSRDGYGSSRSSVEHSAPGGKAENYPYDFSYEVMAPESGVSLGHHENHDGSSAEGVYHNLLPDGRLLTVEYWADDSGFKPKLSYKLLHASKSDNSGPY